MTSLLEEASIKTHQHLQENSNEHIIGQGLASKADSLGLHFRVVVVDNAMVIRHQPYITPRTEGGPTLPWSSCIPYLVDMCDLIALL